MYPYKFKMFKSTKSEAYKMVLEILLTLVFPESDMMLIQNSRNGSNALKTQKGILKVTNRYKENCYWQGFLASIINRNWQKARQEIQATVYWGPCYSMGESNGTLLQYSCLENPMEGGAWWAAVHGVATSQTLLSDFTFTSCFHVLEKEMATHSSILAWKMPWTEEPGRL